MLEWISQMIIIGGMLTSYSVSTANKLARLPPQPTQDQVQCHDAAWEKQNLVEIEGFRINKLFKPYISQLISDGLNNGANITINSAYRNCDEQGSLRASACGLGDYNLYIKPIINCSPPTEPAGRSLHNEGLAIDLACQGYTLFQYSPCYSWLKLNSTKYQIIEHQLEAWHWSTTGH